MVELHRLHNRSCELWLVVLAAFFEEQCGMVGLLDAISNAAEWDEQISKGKSLSEREEADLQALELMTRGKISPTDGFLHGTGIYLQ
jgi:hypothetical protein